MEQRRWQECRRSPAEQKERGKPNIQGPSNPRCLPTCFILKTPAERWSLHIATCGAHRGGRAGKDSRPRVSVHSGGVTPAENREGLLSPSFRPRRRRHSRREPGRTRVPVFPSTAEACAPLGACGSLEALQALLAPCSDPAEPSSQAHWCPSLSDDHSQGGL